MHKYQYMYHYHIFLSHLAVLHTTHDNQIISQLKCNGTGIWGSETA